MNLVKLVPVILFLVFVFHVFSKLGFTGYVAVTELRGDCDRNNVLNWNDVNCYKEVLRYGYQYYYLDLNQDNVVDREDLLLLQDKLTR